MAFLKRRDQPCTVAPSPVAVRRGVVRAAIPLATIVGALLVGVTGCTTADPAGGRSSIASAISAAQASELGDGEVSIDEYQAAYQRYAACLDKSGFTVVYGGLQENVIQYSVPDAAVTSGADKTCYAFEFGQVDSMWQVAHQNDSESARIIRKCLIDAGIEPAEEYDDLVTQLHDHPTVEEKCLG